MSKIAKIMNNEIKKYQGRIYYLDIQKDFYGNDKKPTIKPADWIVDTNSYDHFSFELHHVIKFTHYEQNKNWYENQGLKMCLILIPKVLHQHLENPVYELDDSTFYNKYKIHKYELLFDKNDYFAGNYPEILKKGSTDLNFDDCDLSCFDEVMYG